MKKHPLAGTPEVFKGTAPKEEKEWWEDFSYAQYPKTTHTYLGSPDSQSYKDLEDKVRQTNYYILCLPYSHANKLIIVDDEDPAVRDIFSAFTSLLDTLQTKKNSIEKDA
jgi:hypothetical protein